MAESMSMSLGNKVPTQETQELLSQETDDVQPTNSESVEENKFWARLISINKLFPSVHCDSKKFRFGRASSCDYTFLSDQIRTSKYAATYSSVHFQLELDEKTGEVWIEDSSMNGTFINGERIGKGNRRCIENNDEISLSAKSNRIFIFIRNQAREDLTIPQRIREKYLFSRTIGRGTYGEVKLCFDRKSWQNFAVKIVLKKHFVQFGAAAALFNEKLRSEFKILAQLNHPSIVEIFDVEESDEAIYTILELVDGGELFQRILSNGQIDEKTSKLIFRQIALGVEYLHENRVTHRDLKPENILLVSRENDESLIKITDFGLSKLIDERSLMKTFCGTPNYLAPEVLSTRGESSYTEKVDIWSLGVILFVCLVGYPPFTPSAEIPSLEEQIIRGNYDFAAEFWSGVSESAKDLIRKMLCVDPKVRFSIKQVLEHPWLSDDHENTAKLEQMIEAASSHRRLSKRRHSTDEVAPMEQSFSRKKSRI